MTGPVFFNIILKKNKKGVFGAETTIVEKMSQEKRQEKEGEKDRVRHDLDERDELEAAHEERGTEKMGDLHLNEEGWSKKAKRRFRRRVKHYSDKARRREDKRLSRWRT